MICVYKIESENVKTDTTSSCIAYQTEQMHESNRILIKLHLHLQK